MLKKLRMELIDKTEASSYYENTFCVDWTPMWKLYNKKVEGEENIFVFKMSAATSPNHNQKNLAMYINLPLRTQMIFVIYFTYILHFFPLRIEVCDKIAL